MSQSHQSIFGNPVRIRFDETPYTGVPLKCGKRLMLNLQTEADRRAYYRPLLKIYGQAFKRQTYPFEKYPLFDPKNRCYDTAALLARNHQHLTYVEGVVVFETDEGYQSMGHGWCVDLEGGVVDPVGWLYQHEPSVTYIGIPLKTTYAQRWKIVAGYYGMMDGWPDGRRSPIYEDDVEQWSKDVAGDLIPEGIAEYLQLAAII